ncbi:hypothetical protein SAMN05443244_0989 [Terriglobus roseus]|uniref:Uncharacterized protein n=1 Tax=Terriglobus roseus TaxID=392734 RepID=A0A1H4K4W6_9BACT|nr:hypothetical protein SAMN05443244_0989 [Terriglobus roseus]
MDQPACNLRFLRFQTSDSDALCCIDFFNIAATVGPNHKSVRPLMGTITDPKPGIYLLATVTVMGRLRDGRICTSFSGTEFSPMKEKLGFCVNYTHCEAELAQPVYRFVPMHVRLK